MEAIKYRGFKIKPDYDEYPESPREWDNIGKLCMFSRSHCFPNESDYKDYDELMKFIKKESYVYCDVYKYEHSGICLNTTGFCDRWDSGLIGVIYVDKKTLLEEFKWVTSIGKEDVLQRLLKEEVETYSKFLSGECYDYTTEDANGNRISGCCGYFDYDEVIIRAKEELDCHIKYLNLEYLPGFEIAKEEG